MIASRACRRNALLRRWSCVGALVVALALALAGVAAAAEPDLARAEQRVREGKYQEAYDLLAPFEDARRDDPSFTYLLGRAARSAASARTRQKRSSSEASRLGRVRSPPISGSAART